MYKTSEICTVCHSKSLYHSFYIDSINYSSCDSCYSYIGFSDTNANFQKLEDYEPAYIDYLTTSESKTAQHNQILGWLKNNINDLEQKSILDIGCGSGIWINYLNNKNYKATGIEPSIELYNKYLSTSSSFFNCELEQVSEKFDVLTVLDVIEHVPNVSQFVSQLVDKIAPDGYLVIVTPKANSWNRRLFGRYWHYFNRYHYSLMTSSALIHLMNKNGLVLKNESSIPRLVSINYVLNYAMTFLFRRGTNVKTGKKTMLKMNLRDVIYHIYQKN